MQGKRDKGDAKFYVDYWDAENATYGSIQYDVQFHEIYIVPYKVCRLYTIEVQYRHTTLALYRFQSTLIIVRTTIASHVFKLTVLFARAT